MEQKLSLNHVSENISPFLKVFNFKASTHTFKK